MDYSQMGLQQIQKRIDEENETIKLSKELLTSLLGTEVTGENQCYKITDFETVINYDESCGCCNKNINLNELVLFAKDVWSYQFRCYIVSGLKLQDTNQHRIIEVKNFKYETIYKDTSTIGEPKGILNACEWIVKNLKVEE